MKPYFVGDGRLRLYSFTVPDTDHDFFMKMVKAAEQVFSTEFADQYAWIEEQGIKVLYSYGGDSPIPNSYHHEVDMLFEDSDAFAFRMRWM